MKRYLSGFAILWLASVALWAGCRADNGELALVAGGSFMAGSTALLTKDNPERPAQVAAFHIMRHEVTVARYTDCVAAGACAAIHLAGPFGRDDLPMTHVTWDEAQSYCRWRGMRLPTENEWERAARGRGNTLYPWGDEFAPEAANGGHAKACRKKDTVFRFAAPGGCFPKDRSDFGVMDMAGNVAEWTAEVYSPEPGRGGDAAVKVVKGGYFYAEPNQLSGAWREASHQYVRSPRIGFRCVKDVD